MELSGIVPLPVSVADNTASAFLPLDGVPALARVVSSILGVVAEPGRVVVAAAEPLIGEVRAALASPDLDGVSIAAVGGTATRADCLKAALASVERQPFSTSHVLVHDISSPLTSPDLTERVIEAMRGGGAIVTPILAVTDSVKAVDTNGAIIATVDRSALRAVQYPRGFAVGALAELLGQDVSDDVDEIATAIDAAAHITVVDGDPDVFRVELPGDAELIEAIIASRESDPRGR
ncbi:4-diphosphocytidyl-2-methyl-D-erythritol synthase [Mycolicibacterium rhodesiae NBB3]|uniref:4-diphosphocytidyl-2-methyl-D-erythritol synthase n=1 Tax=Mycolicibacterium rhodesiae (strain NBB3) TaxID=710685 RepID=G8RH85_MYCRN|nr:2-C-methyl-D-erythritol 4-phosphate cytidylyltransferase [Mycolicibacterium rhodesiae]AEV74565.1 4-diphosphocytidyl-2-methyl-D-erythritol synthase [Mycolicibacterium rhodesiae NBB3]